MIRAVHTKENFPSGVIYKVLLWRGCSRCVRGADDSARCKFKASLRFGTLLSLSIISFIWGRNFSYLGLLRKMEENLVLLKYHSSQFVSATTYREFSSFENVHHKNISCTSSLRLFYHLREQDRVARQPGVPAPRNTLPLSERKLCDCLEPS